GAEGGSRSLARRRGAVGMRLDRLALSASLSMATLASGQTGPAPPAAQGAPEVRVGTLGPGKTIAAEPAGGGSHAVQLDLDSGEFLSLRVSHQGVELVVTLVGPDGQRLAGVESFSGPNGSETLAVITPLSGAHRLEIRPRSDRAASGLYAISLQSLRCATSADPLRVRATESSTRGERLLEEDPPAALTRAATDLEEALALWQEVEEPSGEAQAMLFLGQVRYRQGERAKALTLFFEALVRAEEREDPRGSADALHQVGIALLALGESERALNYHQQALALRRAL